MDVLFWTLLESSFVQCWSKGRGMIEMKEKSELGSVAAILERELAPTIKEWLRRVNLVSRQLTFPFH